MSDNNLIKSITTHSCPKCGEEIFIESQMTPSYVASLFTKEDVAEAKNTCLERVATLDIPDEKREAVVRWLNDDSTIFGPDEVESIILSLLKPE